MNGIKKFNWVRRPSAWESMQTWRNQRAEATAKFIEQQTAAVNAFASAHSNNTAGLVANAQQAAIDRLRAASRVNKAA